MSKTPVPVLVLHGALDRQVPAAHADLLEQAGRARKKMTATAPQKVIVPGVNHLLTPAKTGDTEEYLSLETRTIAPAVTSALSTWLSTTIPPKK
jgi:fermentation-respiration switch protein FrsA (DUF1100 family)